MQNILDEFQLFIFDWDGTLSESSILLKISNMFKKRYKAKHIIENTQYYKKAKLNVKEEAQKNKIYAFLYEIYSIFRKPRLREGSRELLRYLKENKKKVAVFSDAKYYRLKKEIERAKIGNYVDFAVSAQSINSYKPHPSGILFIAKKLHIKKQKVLYVGDMTSDIFTARFADIKSCAICGGMNSYQDLKEAGPGYIFNSIEDFLRKLKK